ncbi:reverse transcriptase domain-containing protein [Tanacetum coccineum]
MAKRYDLRLTALAFITSAGRVSSVSSSTNTCLLKCAKLVDAILLSALTFLFLLLGTCLIENALKLLDDPSVNKIHGSGSSSSASIRVSGESSSGCSTMKSASICPLTDTLGLRAFRLTFTRLLSILGMGDLKQLKGKILADFIVELPEEDSSDTLMEAEEELPEPWILFTDGSSCTDGSETGLILTNPEGMGFTYSLRFSSFKAFSIRQVPRSENKKADALSKIASTSFAHLSKQVLVEELKEKSISEVEILAIIEEEGDTWMTPIFEYLTEETLPADVKKARAVRCKSQRFAVNNGTLYKKSFLGPWLRCVGTLQANYVLREIHEGSCSMHAGTRSVVAKALRIGYYWPTMHKDGIDIARPFLKGPGKVKFLMVAIDYFTKWIEAKPVATITGNQIKKFMWDNIVCRFRLPGEIIADNGKERANRNLGEGIKARLDARSKNWMEELPHVLWAHRTMIKSSNGDTPFSLTYEMEAVIPAEIGMPTLRIAEVDLVQNNEALEINLDLLEERREEAAIREAKSKAKMEKYYNSKV